MYYGEVEDTQLKINYKDVGGDDIKQGTMLVEYDASSEIPIPSPGPRYTFDHADWDKSRLTPVVTPVGEKYVNRNKDGGDKGGEVTAYYTTAPDAKITINYLDSEGKQLQTETINNNDDPKLFEGAVDYTKELYKTITKDNKTYTLKSWANAADGTPKDTDGTFTLETVPAETTINATYEVEKDPVDPIVPPVVTPGNDDDTDDNVVVDPGQQPDTDKLTIIPKDDMIVDSNYQALPVYRNPELTWRREWLDTRYDQWRVIRVAMDASGKIVAYDLGRNQWVDANLLLILQNQVKPTVTESKAIVYSNGRQVPLYTAADLSQQNGNLQDQLQKNRTWQAYQVATKNGQITAYKLGNNQWVDAKNVELKAPLSGTFVLKDQATLMTQEGHSMAAAPADAYKVFGVRYIDGRQALCLGNNNQWVYADLGAYYPA
ncbi:hypothetical protein ACFQ5M_01975 [Agrilactobacillus yilanensis]|uniref:MucBP domain-containing protein n=1 Tax=Agrilactobacillus yilanensis TaxID=2485997 RepID=A0ABW4J3D8_9LACO|nr:hypothetical protein [Agrilactobacillus yilanensis]